MEREIGQTPASEYKTATPQVVLLSAQAQAFIASLPHGEPGPYLFRATAGRDLYPVSARPKPSLTG